MRSIFTYNKVISQVESYLGYEAGCIAADILPIYCPEIYNEERNALIIGPNEVFYAEHTLTAELIAEALALMFDYNRRITKLREEFSYGYIEPLDDPVAYEYGCEY